MPHPIRIPWTVRKGWDEFGAPRPNLAGGKHNGFDYHVPVGTPIYGTGPGGRVTQKGTGAGPNSFGNNITIAYPGRVTGDAHMQSPSPLAVGAWVDQNTIVGHVGNTGSAAGVVWQGLGQDHHELRVGGVLTDPISYYGNSSTAGGGGTPIPPIAEETDMLLKLSALGFWTLYTSEGMYVIGAQANADKVNRCLISGGASAADMQYLNGVLYGPRWGWDTASSSFQPNQPSILQTGSGTLSTAQNTMLMTTLPALVNDVPTNGEMAQLLTSTVVSVNQHDDVNKDIIIAAINANPAAAVGAPLTVTLTGTATPEV
jgi:hypothetical protein